MPKEIANKTKEETYYKCTHCGDEIFWNTHKNSLTANARKFGLMVVARIGAFNWEPMWSGMIRIFLIKLRL